MNIEMSVKMKRIDENRCKASLHLDLGGGGFTITNILIRISEKGGNIITFPLMQIGEGKKPVITLAGSMKQATVDLLADAHRTLMKSGEKTVDIVRGFDDSFAPVSGEK